jgi:hypothetical protein
MRVLYDRAAAIDVHKAVPATETWCWIVRPMEGSRQPAWPSSGGVSGQPDSSFCGGIVCVPALRRVPSVPLLGSDSAMSRILSGLRALLTRPHAGELARALGGGAVDSGLDHREDRALHAGG